MTFGEPPSGDRVQGGDVLTRGVDPEPLSALTAQPRSFCGGENWEAVLADLVVPLLPRELRGIARDIVEELAALETPVRVLNHGDLAGSNVPWQNGAVVGVLDWDLASREDPADDVASLADWHGWDVAPHLADGRTVSRARAFSRSFPLQAVGFAVTSGRPADEIRRTVDRAAQRIDG